MVRLERDTISLVCGIFFAVPRVRALQIHGSYSGYRVLNATNKPLSDFQRLTACPENRSPRILEHIVCADDGQIGFVAPPCGGGQFIRLNEQGIMLFGISGYEIGAGTKRGDGANDVLV